MAVDVIDEEIGWTLLTRHVDSLFLNFPNMKRGMTEEEKSIKTITTWQLGKWSVRPMPVWLSSRKTWMGSSKQIIPRQSTLPRQKTVVDPQPRKQLLRRHQPKNDSIPISSRFNIDGSTAVLTPNAAQTQTIGVASILSTSQEGIDPDKVDPHIIQDRPRTKNVTRERILWPKHYQRTLFSSFVRPCIRRINLDAFWSRARETIASLNLLGWLCANCQPSVSLGEYYSLTLLGCHLDPPPAI